MSRKIIGMLLIVIGGLMVVYTSYNYVTSEKVAEFGSIKIFKEKNNYVYWTPLLGVILVISGIAVILTDKKVQH